jgi:hypothetical protein
MSHTKQVRMSHDETSWNESCLDGRLIVLCVFFLLDGRMEGKVYGFGVENIEITKVAKKAKITKVAEKAKITKVAKKAEITKVAKMAEITKVAKMAEMTERV